MVRDKLCSKGDTMNLRGMIKNEYLKNIPRRSSGITPAINIAGCEWPHCGDAAEINAGERRYCKPHSNSVFNLRLAALNGEFRPSVQKEEGRRV